MAQPRIFISSTCYDLQEIRFQLRTFIDDFGFIPVMSEFGDIFFDYQKHIQDSCKDEIDKSQLFILIVGNNFGSIYYKQKDLTSIPDSVTMQEFRRAIESDIYKHIFINKFVDYDYKNFQKSLNKHITSYLEKNEIDENQIDNTIITLKNDFNISYPFPQESYKFIFNFLDIIYSLKTNNAIITYESFEDIKDSLRKQWSGFMYDSITKSKSVSVSLVEKIGEKITRVENQIRLLAEGQISKQSGASKITFDISKLAKELNLEEFAKIKNEVHTMLNNLLEEDTSPFESHERIRFRQKVETKNINEWLISLEKIIKLHKWANSVSVTIVFSGIGVKYVYYKRYKDIPFDLLVNFYSLYTSAKENLSEEDIEGLFTVICNKFNEYYEPEPQKNTDDLPF